MFPNLWYYITTTRILYIKGNVVSVCVFVTDSTDMGQRVR